MFRGALDVFLESPLGFRETLFLGSDSLLTHPVQGSPHHSGI